jgi:hypothetical protein
MKPKQLAHILVRIVGLLLGAQSVAPVLAGLLALCSAPMGYGTNYKASMGFYVLTNLAPMALGGFLIVRSRWVVAKLFADEPE